MSKKNLPAIVQTDTEEALFLATLNARAETNRRDAELAQMQRALVHSEMTRREEKRAAQREMKGLTAFVGVFACLFTRGTWLGATRWWTAVAPLALMLALLLWAGW